MGFKHAPNAVEAVYTGPRVIRHKAGSTTTWMTPSGDISFSFTTAEFGLYLCVVYQCVYAASTSTTCGYYLDCGTQIRNHYLGTNVYNNTSLLVPTGVHRIEQTVRVDATTVDIKMRGDLQDEPDVYMERIGD